LVPAPRGTGIVSARVPKKILTIAGIDDVYTSSKGSTKTLGNFAKATFAAITATYSFLTPDLWPEHRLLNHPFAHYSEFLSAPKVEKYHREERDREQRGDRPEGGRGGFRGRRGGFRGGRGGFRGGDRQEAPQTSDE